MIQRTTIILLLTIGCSSDKIGDLPKPEKRGSEDVIPIDDPSVPSRSIGVVKLAVLGDSLAAGMLGDTVMGEALSSSTDHPLLQVLIEGGGNHGANFASFYKENHENAYTYGQKEGCFSHACRMDLGAEQVINAAVSGAKVDDLNVQLRAVAGGAERYIIQVGVNDFCADDYVEEDFIFGLRGIIEDALSQRQRARVLVVPILDIVRLFDDVLPDDKATHVPALGDRTCEEVRRAFAGDGYCNRVASQDQRLELSEELTSVNARIVGLASEYEAGRVVIAESVIDLEFAPNHLAADCFHLSREGLKLLATETWKYRELFW